MLEIVEGESLKRGVLVGGYDLGEVLGGCGVGLGKVLIGRLGLAAPRSETL